MSKRTKNMNSKRQRKPAVMWSLSFFYTGPDSSVLNYLQFSFRLLSERELESSKRLNKSMFQHEIAYNRSDLVFLGRKKNMFLYYLVKMATKIQPIITLRSVTWVLICLDGLSDAVSAFLLLDLKVFSWFIIYLFNCTRLCWCQWGSYIELLKRWASL